MSDFAKKLRYYRKRKKLSQTDLAKKINYGYTAITNYEGGRNEPSIDILILLAEILDVTVEELIGVELKTEEKRLIASFKKLSEEKRKMILDLAEAFSFMECER